MRALQPPTVGAIVIHITAPLLASSLFMAAAMTAQADVRMPEPANESAPPPQSQAPSLPAQPAPGPPEPAAAPSAAARKGERLAEQHLFGDWGGWRTSLWERGFEPKLLLISDPYGNSRGGLEQGFSTYSMLSADLKVDTGRALSLPGGEIQMGFSVNFGTQLSQQIVGNTFPIQSSDVAPPGPRLTTLSYTHSLLDDTISLRIGRLSIDSLYGEEFAGSSYFRQFTSVAFNAIPFAIFYNAPGALGYPATTWGARVRYAPRGEVYAMAGVYNADPDVGLAARHGLDFSLQGPAFAIGEVGWLRNQGPGASGLRGNLKLGGFMLGGAVTAYDGGERSGRHGFYVVADQAIHRLGSGGIRQLGWFGSLVAAPDEAVSPMPLFFSTGLVVNGPFARRPDDFLALGIAYGGYSAALRDQQDRQAWLDASIRPQVSELTLELSYGLQLRPGLILQPGAQLVIRPGGSPQTPNALALGLNAVVSF
jgi:porin